MSYYEDDARAEAAWESMSEELYPEHKEQAIGEFSEELLQSFYLMNPNIILPGLQKYNEASEMIAQHPSASYVFSTIAIETFLKTALLKPVLYGLVHTESVADIVMEATLSQSGLERYKKLMSALLKELAGIDVGNYKRSGSTIPLFTEVEEIIRVRNRIVHRAESVGEAEARHANEVALAILDVLKKMINAIGLEVNSNNEVCRRREGVWRA